MTDFEIVVNTEDLERRLKMWNFVAEKWPRLEFFTFADRLKAELETALNLAAPWDTGTMAKSSTAEIDIKTKFDIDIIGFYDVPYARHVIDGTSPSPGRFVPGLIPTDTSNWNFLGARLSMRKAMERGQSPMSIGLHPGTPAQGEQIKDLIYWRMQDAIDKEGAVLNDRLVAFLAGDVGI